MKILQAILRAFALSIPTGYILLVAAALGGLPSGCYAQTPPIHFGETTGTAQIPEYDRGEWGRWRDDDGDCQDTRQEVLIEASLEPVIFEDERKCRVAEGKWRDPYTGRTFTDPSDIDIDHVVAIKEAHDAGGWAWDKERKRAYFNHLENSNHLVASWLSSNRSKGSRGPDEWLPPDPTFRCEYLKMRLEILAEHGLAYDCALYVRLMTEHCR